MNDQAQAVFDRLIEVATTADDPDVFSDLIENGILDFLQLHEPHQSLDSLSLYRFDGGTPYASAVDEIVAAVLGNPSFPLKQMARRSLQRYWSHLVDNPALIFAYATMSPGDDLDKLCTSIYGKRIESGGRRCFLATLILALPPDRIARASALLDALNEVIQRDFPLIPLMPSNPGEGDTDVVLYTDPWIVALQNWSESSWTGTGTETEFRVEVGQRIADRFVSLMAAVLQERSVDEEAQLVARALLTSDSGSQVPWYQQGIPRYVALLERVAQMAGEPPPRHLLSRVLTPEVSE